MRRGQAFSLLPTSRADSTTILPNFEMYHVSDLGFDAPAHLKPCWDQATVSRHGNPF